jgi:hypothetical protein
LDRHFVIFLSCFCLKGFFFQGNVFPTAGGGAQVVLNDVEILKQTSPTSVKKRRLPEAMLPGEIVDSKCKTGIIGGLTSKKSKRQL